jgi:hypothetical protein
MCQGAIAGKTCKKILIGLTQRFQQTRVRESEEFLSDISPSEFDVEDGQFQRAITYLIVSIARNIVTSKTPSCVLVKSMFDALISAPLNQWNNKEQGKLSAMWFLFNDC